jgi:putative transcriptional regulator
MTADIKARAAANTKKINDLTVGLCALVAVSSGLTVATPFWPAPLGSAPQLGVVVLAAAVAVFAALHSLYWWRGLVRLVGRPPMTRTPLNRLKVCRAERDWTQADLAERLGVSRQTVQALEKGRYDPSLPLAFRIARLLDQPIEAIFVA